MTRLAEDATPYLAAAIRVDEEMNRLEGVLGFSGMMNGKELALLYTDSHTFNVVYDGQKTSTSFMPTATGNTVLSSGGSWWQRAAPLYLVGCK